MMRMGMMMGMPRRGMTRRAIPMRGRMRMGMRRRTRT